MQLPILATTEPKKHALLDFTPEQWQAWLEERKQPDMRRRQILRWVMAGRAEAFEQMSDLPKDFRPLLAEQFDLFSSKVETHRIAMDNTHKLVVRLQDGGLIECVLIQEGDRRTACISTQVGCAMGCVFCASGLNGVERNLTSGEILEELIRLRNLTAPGERLTNVVVMGMGEPLANLDNLLEALRLAGDAQGLNLGARHITISTVGLPAKMRRLAEVGKQYHLAVSLHAPNDDLRTKIVPTNEKTGIEEIMAAADYFFEQTGRRVTYEYVVLGGVNDGTEHARELADLLRSRNAFVNLIPFNDVDGLPWKAPKELQLNKFILTLKQAGIDVQVRKRKGADIDAACGQLRRKVQEEALAQT
jgi:23S rRNA (adenine2503-C2)-methyltransferase